MSTGEMTPAELFSGRLLIGDGDEPAQFGHGDLALLEKWRGDDPAFIDHLVKGLTVDTQELGGHLQAHEGSRVGVQVHDAGLSGAAHGCTFPCQPLAQGFDRS